MRELSLIQRPEPRGGDVVAALSLWEPWATFMARGIKTIETRSWVTNYRGPLLICGAKRKMTMPEFELLWDAGLAIEDVLGFGRALCLVDLIDCRATETMTAAAIGPEHPYGNYEPGRFAWITTRRRVFRPFAVRGAQGLFTVRLPEGLEISNAA